MATRERATSRGRIWISACVPGAATSWPGCAAIALGGGGDQRLFGLVRGQARPGIGRQVGDGIGQGIDAGRQVDPRLRRVGVTPPDIAEIAAMGDGFADRYAYVRHILHVRRPRPRCHRDRSDGRLSERRLPPDRPSRHLDRQVHNMVRRGLEFRRPIVARAAAVRRSHADIAAGRSRCCRACAIAAVLDRLLSRHRGA